MLETFKKLFGGAAKAISPVAPAAPIPDEEAWASFEVDPELAYLCRDQGAALADTSPTLPDAATDAASRSAPAAATLAAEVVLPEFRLLDVETSDSESLSMQLGLPDSTPVARSADTEAPVAGAESPGPKKPRAPAKKRSAGKGAATKSRAAKAARSEPAAPKVPKGATRRATIDLRAAWNFNFPDKSLHDDSVETVRLDLVIAE